MRALFILVLIVGGTLGALVLLFPDQFRAMAANDVARLIWLLLAALLVGGGAFGMRGRGGAPISIGRALIYLLIWGAAFAIAVILYQIMQAYRGGGAVVT